MVERVLVTVIVVLSVRVYVVVVERTVDVLVPFEVVVVIANDVATPDLTMAVAVSVLITTEL